MDASVKWGRSKHQCVGVGADTAGTPPGGADDDGDGEKKRDKSVNQINSDIKRDKAPDGIKRADTGKRIYKPGYPGTMVELPNGGTVGLRPKSKSGGPAIDVNIPNVPYDKTHFGPKK